MTEEKSKIPELKVIPAEELLDTTYAPSGTLIDGLIGQGIYILAGAPKVSGGVVRLTSFLSGLAADLACMPGCSIYGSS